MFNLNLKGVWIPIEISTDKKSSDKEKSYLEDSLEDYPG